MEINLPSLRQYGYKNLHQTTKNMQGHHILKNIGEILVDSTNLYNKYKK